MDRQNLLYGYFVTMWTLGIAVSQGFWECLVAVIFPPYAWVLFAEWALRHFP